MKRVEVFFLSDCGTWESELVDVPETIADSESQDSFIKWVYSDDADAQAFVNDWHDDIIAVYVMSWNSDLVAQDDPRLDEEE